MISEENELSKCTTHLLRVLHQSCSRGLAGRTVLDHGDIEEYEEAMDFLAKKGYLEYYQNRIYKAIER